ncbi:MAG: GAF domain-containing protein [Rhodospirillales bacterium]|nr:GAF domain-containing protein [Rhodospirillales bacterium]MBT4040041.1 GAF domain-containing protein [Rhodospirillales bacterium]MBT4627860.1 GAF domain-containing protein [Rhodospirillales bacterium]MBT5351400.1 GAF domain-containing protein [Rhodospirillales bacterium]MBT5522217.1 GAF domain-containing protein [Rhodospirillales bacterium]
MTQVEGADQKASESGDVGEVNFQRLIEIGIALSAERDNARLMERILLEAKDICYADGGTLYLRTEDDRLKFEIMRTDSLGIALGGTTGKTITFPPLMLHDPDTGEPNHKNVASYVALSGEAINIPDAYDSKKFDFSGTKKFDEGTGYRSKSFLTVPLKNNEGTIIGVLQLLNARSRETKEVVPFSASTQPLVEAMTSQAAVALDNALLLEAQKKLFRSFIDLISSAIDAKSPYTGGHCQRVPELTMMMADAAVASTSGPFADFDLTMGEREELEISAALHDCGKVTTPEYVVDKATKLETIYDRLHEIRTRFEIVKRDAEIDYLKAVAAGGDEPALKASYDERIAKLDDDYAFVAECNVGGEFMAPERIDRIKEIAGITWMRTLDDRIGVSFEEEKRKERTPAPSLPVEENLLDDREDHVMYRESGEGNTYGDDNEFGFKLDVPEHRFNLGEVYNLCIARGTLTEEERFKINDHIVQTIIMLEQLPFPRHLKKVPEYAGGHHEKMDGTGYPKKLNRDQMTVPARMMAIADIFEALSAADRPYKAAKKLSDCIKIMSFMKKDAHIDGELFQLFLESGVYKEYSERFLQPEQVDEVDITPYLEQPAAE